MARREKRPFTVKDIDEQVASLQARIKKLTAIKAGMKATKQESLTLDYAAGLNDGLDTILAFCDGALAELRKHAPRGQRPWDEWDK